MPEGFVDLACANRKGSLGWESLKGFAAEEIKTEDVAIAGADSAKAGEPCAKTIPAKPTHSRSSLLTSLLQTPQGVHLNLLERSRQGSLWLGCPTWIGFALALNIKFCDFNAHGWVELLRWHKHSHGC